MGFGTLRKLSVPGLMVLVGVLAVLVSGCGGSTSSGGILPDSQQILRSQLVSGSVDVKTMDPALVQDAYSIVPIEMVFPGLLVEDESGAAIPFAAADMPTFDSTANTYTFHVRPGLKWSDGTAIDANTFAYSINRTENPCTTSPVSYYLFAIKDASTFNTETCTNGTIKGKIQTLIGDSVVVVDPQTLVIKLNQAAPYFLEAFTYPCSYAVPQALVTQYGNATWTNHLVDNGGLGGSEFTVKVWDHKGHIDLLRNPNFWGTAPKIREVDFNIYQTADAEYADYLDGHLDQGVPSNALYKAALKRPDFHKDGALWINYYAMDWNKPPYNDVRVRQALDLALNKNVLDNTVDNGTEVPTNHIVPEGMPGYDASLTGPDGTTNTSGNVQKATSLMDAYATANCKGYVAGSNKFSSCPSITLVAPTGTPYTDQDAAAVVMWQTAFPGMNIKVTFIPFNTLVGNLGTPASPAFWDIAWIADYPDPQDWLSLQFSPTANYNNSHVTIAQANTLMAEADINQDPTSRYQQYNQAEQLLVDQVAWLPYGQQVQSWTVQPWVHGYYLPAAGLQVLTGPESWQSLYLTAH
jgi:peptide/nickel transport system substrate-binding protein/oligopeptide transport system substrate-binding protein